MSQKRRRATKNKYHVKEEYWAAAKQYLLSKHIDIRFTTSITANLSLKPRTKDSYEAHYRAMRYFCCVIGIVLLTRGLRKSYYITAKCPKVRNTSHSSRNYSSLSKLENE
jgi:hypothetical protein